MDESVKILLLFLLMLFLSRWPIEKRSPRLYLFKAWLLPVLLISIGGYWIYDLVYTVNTESIVHTTEPNSVVTSKVAETHHWQTRTIASVKNEAEQDQVIQKLKWTIIGNFSTGSTKAKSHTQVALESLDIWIKNNRIKFIKKDWSQFNPRNEENSHIILLSSHFDLTKLEQLTTKNANLLIVGPPSQTGEVNSQRVKLFDFLFYKHTNSERYSHLVLKGDRLTTSNFEAGARFNFEKLFPSINLQTTAVDGFEASTGEPRLASYTKGNFKAVYIDFSISKNPYDQDLINSLVSYLRSGNSKAYKTWPQKKDLAISIAILARKDLSKLLSLSESSSLPLNKLSLFVIGKDLEGLHPRQLEVLQRFGEVGCLSDSVQTRFDQLGLNDQVEKIKLCVNQIKALSNRTVLGFHPLHHYFNQYTLDAAVNQGMNYVFIDLFHEKRRISQLPTVQLKLDTQAPVVVYQRSQLEGFLRDRVADRLEKGLRNAELSGGFQLIVLTEDEFSENRELLKLWYQKLSEAVYFSNLADVTDWMILRYNLMQGMEPSADDVMRFDPITITDLLNAK